MEPQRILIADDETLLVANLTRAARKAGYHADGAPDGREAWRLLGNNHYDLLVTDLKMPGMDGHKLMELVTKASPATGIIAITGYATLDAAIKCLRKGASDFLIKPFEEADFLAAVGKALSKSPYDTRVMPDWSQTQSRFGLTKRQREVLEAFYTTGKTNQELAEDLFLSLHTVKSHLKAAFEKVGVRSRAQLMLRLQQSEN